MVLNTIVLNKFLHYFERCRLEDQEGDVKIERTVSPHKIHCFSSRISCLQSLSVKNAASLSLASVHFVWECKCSSLPRLVVEICRIYPEDSGSMAFRKLHDVTTQKTTHDLHKAISLVWCGCETWCLNTASVWKYSGLTGATD